MRHSFERISTVGTSGILFVPFKYTGDVEWVPTILNKVSLTCQVDANRRKILCLFSKSSDWNHLIQRQMIISTPKNEYSDRTKQSKGLRH